MALVFSNFQTFLDAVQSITEVALAKAKALLKTDGKEIENISDIFINDNSALFDLLPDGTLVSVSLYIATKEIDRYALKTLESHDLYKYHIYKCSTISTMFHSGRKHRYKINNRDDGTFFYKFHDYHGHVLETRENQKLNICKNCLSKFLSKKASSYDVNNFYLKDYYQQSNNFFDFDTSVMEKGEDAQANIYPKKWTDISNQIKTKYDYTCQECGWRPNTVYKKRFIHTHHQNGDKTNNGEDNLKVLCIACHSNADSYHVRIKSSLAYAEYLEIVT
ncbi:MAG: hypothetical protein Q9M39_06715 [Sulfurovum sp.]|nr:hypothetical protein [Sulfurovum sp.]